MTPVPMILNRRVSQLGTKGYEPDHFLNLQGQFPKRPDFHPEYSARPMFSLRILFWSVVRFSPRRSAAPSLPAILPEAAFNASIMACLSARSKVDVVEATERSDTLWSSAYGTFNS